MKEYLENLKNTQGKKTPPRLTNILPKLGFIMKESPVRTYNQSPEFNLKDEKKIKKELDMNEHSMNDSQESLSVSSDSLENESSDKIEALSEKNDYISQRIKQQRRSTSMSQGQQLFGEDNVIDITGEDQMDRHLITGESEVISDEIVEDKCELRLRRTIASNRRSISCYKDFVVDTSKKSKLEFNLLKVKTKAEDTVDSNQNTWKPIFFFLLVILALFFIYTIWSQPKLENNFAKKYAGFDRLKTKYPNQTNLFWANIESCYRHSILKSKDPSIILIVSDETTRELGNILAYDILSLVHSSVATNTHHLDDLVISPQSDYDLTSLISEDKYDEVKLLIDTKLNRVFMNKKKIALVKDIQEIPATSMLLFYTYGDDLLSAKYPGVVILMTLKLEGALENENNRDFRDALMKSQSKLTSYVEDYLFNLWSKQVGDDQLRPLFTRIANNVVLVNKE